MPVTHHDCKAIVKRGYSISDGPWDRDYAITIRRLRLLPFLIICCKNKYREGGWGNDKANPDDSTNLLAERRLSAARAASSVVSIDRTLV